MLLRFLLDENVPVAVKDVLEAERHDVIVVTELAPVGSPDQVVATISAQEGRILVSHDKDMKRIERYISEGATERFPSLSRLMLTCPEPAAADRLKLFLQIVAAEAERVQGQADSRVLVEIGMRRVRICR